MLNSGKKNCALRDKKINILTLALYEKKILNETKNHNPLQVKWSVILCLLTDDNDNPIIIRPHIVFTDEDNNPNHNTTTYCVY
jgi:hypothetical protein